MNAALSTQTDGTAEHKQRRMCGTTATKTFIYCLFSNIEKKNIALPSFFAPCIHQSDDAQHLSLSLSLSLSFPQFPQFSQFSILILSILKINSFNSLSLSLSFSPFIEIHDIKIHIYNIPLSKRDFRQILSLYIYISIFKKIEKNKTNMEVTPFT